MVSHSQYLDSFHITNTADDLFPVFQGLVHFWYILTFHRQIAQTNRMFMFQHSLPARRTNNGLDNVLLQYPTAFRTFFAEELLNRQVLLGYLLLSFNDNLLRRKRKNRTLNRSKPFLPKLCSQRQLGNEAVVTLRGKNQPRTQRPRPRLISNFFLTLLYWWWRHLYSYVFNVYYFTISVTQITVCGLRSAVCSLQMSYTERYSSEWE